ncbi:MAG: hypothetical protein ACK56F_15995 [bacterium]
MGGGGGEAGKSCPAWGILSGEGGDLWQVNLAGHVRGWIWRVSMARHFGGSIWRVKLAHSFGGFSSKEKIHVVEQEKEIEE